MDSTVAMRSNKHGQDRACSCQCDMQGLAPAAILVPSPPAYNLRLQILEAHVTDLGERKKKSRFQEQH